MSRSRVDGSWRPSPPLTDERLLDLAARPEGFRAGDRWMVRRCRGLMRWHLLMPLRRPDDHDGARYRVTITDRAERLRVLERCRARRRERLEAQASGGDRLCDGTALPPSHPDGHAHKKACPQCAFRRSNPQDLTSGDREALELNLNPIECFTFMCVHRVEDGCIRECACWAALKARHDPKISRAGASRRTGEMDGQERTP